MTCLVSPHDSSQTLLGAASSLRRSQPAEDLAGQLSVWRGIPSQFPSPGCEGGSLSQMGAEALSFFAQGVQASRVHSPGIGSGESYTAPEIPMPP